MARQIKRWSITGNVLITKVDEVGQWVRWSDVAPMLAEADRAAPNNASTCATQIAAEMDIAAADAYDHNQPTLGRLLESWGQRLRAG